MPTWLTRLSCLNSTTLGLLLTLMVLLLFWLDETRQTQRPFVVAWLHRLELLAATGNVRSRAVAERLGMSREGVRREAELLSSGFVDLVLYAVLARDWPGAAAVTQAAAGSSGGGAQSPDR